MAMQDSRTMNFKNLCFLSANEGNLPKISATTSFIPHSIRKHFGLNTVDKNEEIQRHNFLRLVNSAENISFVYVLGNQGLGNGEMSRFLLQMLVDDKYKVSQYFIKENKIEKAENKIIEVEKTPEIYQKIIKKYDSKTENANILSPTALNRYIDCPLQFYFRYVAEIKKPDDSSNMDAAKLGSVLHKVMENFYAQKLEKIDDNLVEISFNEFFNINKEDYSGEHLIFIDVIKEMAKNIIDSDKKSQNLEILGVEKKVEIEVKLDNNISVKIGGTIDRMDNIPTSTSSANYCRIVDYKTGKAPNAKDIAVYAKEVEKLFGEKRRNPANYVFQIFLYSYILKQNRSYDRISSALIYPLQLRDEDYSPVVIDDFNEIKDNFEAEFLKKLNELFNPNTPFTQCEHEANCKYCDYKNLCSRV
jgi:ATP-dependent helicase/DNAse subunit B